MSQISRLTIPNTLKFRVEFQSDTHPTRSQSPNQRPKRWPRPWGFGGLDVQVEFKEGGSRTVGHGA